MTPPVPPRAGRREWIGLAVIALPCLLYSMDLTVLHLAVPALTEDLQPSSAQLLWIIDIYGFFIAGSLITMRTLGDRVGRRRLLMIGAIAFGVASVLAALSTTAEMLIVTRALLGIAGATVAPSTLSLIRNMFLDDGQRTRAISVWMTAFSLGGVLGPFVGGVLLQFFAWGSVFLIAVPIMALVLATAPFLLPEYRDPAAGRIDLPSAALSMGAVLGVIYGVKALAQDGPGAVPAAVSLAGLALGAVFARRQLRLADPLIDLRLFTRPAFAASVATYGFAIFVLFGGFLYLPQYLQLVRGLSPLEAGLWGAPSASAWVVGAIVTPTLARRMRPATLMVAGLIVTAGGFAYLTGLDADTGFVAYVLATTAFALGSAPIFTLTNDLMIGTAPPERAGAAAGISETSAELGGALGIAVFGSVGVATYRGMLGGASLPGVPAEAVATAMDTLGGAAAVAQALSPAAASTLLAASREAFLLGLHVCAGISAVLVLALAAFVWVELGALAARGR
ncbi:MAG: MFS transporter [Gemmatimonadetes bacterium]|nr:MFS transporter [Gemmatimonadota bacterium]